MRTKLTLILLFVSCMVVNAQNPDSSITRILQQCTAIRTDSGFQQVILNDIEFLDTLFLNQPEKGFGILTAFYKNGKLFRIHEYIGIKDLKHYALTEYFFYDSQLIYVDEWEKKGSDIYSDGSGTIEYKIPKPDFTGCYYFENGKIIYKKQEGDPFLIPNEKFFYSQSKEGQLLTTVSKYIDLLSKKQ